jgi:hypothetical protein
LEGKALVADLHDEKTNRKLLSKGVELTRDIIEKLRARDLKRLRLKDKDARVNEQIDEIGRTRQAVRTVPLTSPATGVCDGYATPFHVNG